MNPSIEGYLDALLEGANDDEVRAMAEQTVAVAGLVLGNRQLRSALTDTAMNCVSLFVNSFTSVRHIVTRCVETLNRRDAETYR